MKLFTWKSGDITTRLVMIAVVPATLMFLAISVALYSSSQNEIMRDIKERGNVLAAALAESSIYAVDLPSEFRASYCLRMAPWLMNS